MNHPHRKNRFDLTINCAGTGEDWRPLVLRLLGSALRVIEFAGQTEGTLHARDGRQVGRWSYRAPADPKPRHASPDAAY